MSHTAAQTSVTKTIVVHGSQQRAFAVFTEGIGTWWPLQTHKIGAADPIDAVLEPRTGGRWYEVGADGSQCEWGRVLAWEPPGRVVLAWQIGVDWRYDPELVTEVDVRFTDLGDGRTRVTLEHRNLDRFGPGAEQARATFDSPGGWSGLLDAYGQGVAAR